MAIIEITGGPITHHYLMGKTKTEIASMYMRLLHDTEQDANDAARLDWLETHPHPASLVIDGHATGGYLYGIFGAMGLKLREILDAAMAKESGR